LSLLAACAAPPPAPITLRVAATDLTAPLLSDLIEAYADANPGVTLSPTVVPLSTLNADLAAGRADLALSANPGPDQFTTPLGYVSFIVVVHPNNPIIGLSAAQMLMIFAGRVTSWGQVGGPEGEIQIVIREDASDAAKAFGASALSGALPTPNALVVPSWEAMREAVSQNPNAIGYVPLPELDATVKRVETRDPASLRVLMAAVAAGEPSGPARDFLAWAQSEAGQRVVAQRYAPIK
jgi:phosphate transport system substrate-binding protein